jgi:hypothetical protein
VNIQLLIDSIVRQTTVLIAQLATLGGARTPLGSIAEQVFVELTRELHRQGVSRKVAADMFGVALRTYRRRIQRSAESRTREGHSLWEAVHRHIGEHPAISRRQLIQDFRLDDEDLVQSLLKDLVDSGLVYRAGKGDGSSYRAATRSDLDRLAEDTHDHEGTDALLWAIVYRIGPIERARLAEQSAIPARELEAALSRLVAAGRIEAARSDADVVYRAQSFVVPLGQPAGWEAGVFDHFQALVMTICAKLGQDRSSPELSDRIGGSTYTLEVWPGHPFETEALGALSDFRARMGDLRSRIVAHNRSIPLPEERARVVVYGGQCVIEAASGEHD